MNSRNLNPEYSVHCKYMLLTFIPPFPQLEMFKKCFITTSTFYSPTWAGSFSAAVFPFQNSIFLCKKETRYHSVETKKPLLYKTKTIFSQTYSVAMLLANWGGMWGFALGFSIVCFIEFFYILLISWVYPFIIFKYAIEISRFFVYFYWFSMFIFWCT